LPFGCSPIIIRQIAIVIEVVLNEVSQLLIAHHDDDMLIMHPDLNIGQNPLHVFLNKTADADRKLLAEPCILPSASSRLRPINAALQRITYLSLAPS
jgi:hypothetical protein